MLCWKPLRWKRPKEENTDRHFKNYVVFFSKMYVNDTVSNICNSSHNEKKGWICVSNAFKNVMRHQSTQFVKTALYWK